MEYPAAELARRGLLSLMDDCSVLSQTVLQWISRCPQRLIIDREIGDLANDRLGGQELLTYVRYNVIFEPAWIARGLGTVVDPNPSPRCTPWMTRRISRIYRELVP